MSTKRSRLMTIALTLMLLLSANFSTTSQAQGTSQSATTSEWTPTNKQCVPVLTDEEHTVVINVYYSPINEKERAATSDESKRAYTVEDTAEAEWKIPATSLNITGKGSENRLPAFIECCKGADNFADACKGDVFVKVLRKTKNGNWDREWNKTSPWLRLRANSTNESVKEKTTIFFREAFPKLPRALELAATEQQASDSSATVTTAATNTGGNGPQK